MGGMILMNRSDYEKPIMEVLQLQGANVFTVASKDSEDPGYEDNWD